MSFCASLVDEWIRCGLKQVVISPGSRSTPMAISMIARAELEVHLRLDERSSGFYALGIARSTGIPVAVLVTSGTAVAELLPAASEALYGRVPLLLLTADRPPRLQGIGAPQTMAQVGILGTSVKEVYDPGVPDLGKSGHWRSLACHAYSSTLQLSPGPVQVNLAFDEPLIDGPAVPTVGRPAGMPWSTRGVTLGVPDGRVLDSIFDPKRNGIIILGGGSDIGGSATRLAELLGWPLLADPLSGGISEHPNCIRYFDSILRSERASDVLLPERVVRFGDVPSSKVLGSFLSKCANDPTVVVAGFNQGGVIADPDRIVEVGLSCDLELMLDQVLERVGRLNSGRNSGYLDRWLTLDEAVATKIEVNVDSADSLTEVGVARMLASSLGPSDCIVVSSSMPVRDLEWYAGKRSGFPRVISNRGLNGIDGVVSTFLGVAAVGGPQSLVVGLLGDLALLHDFGSLTWRPAELPKGLLLVNDNDGGSIFSFLAQKEQVGHTEFERVFGTPHGSNLLDILIGVGLSARRVSNSCELMTLIDDAREGSSLKIGVVQSDRQSNLELHKMLSSTCVLAVDSLIESEW